MSAGHRLSDADSDLRFTFERKVCDFAARGGRCKVLRAHPGNQLEIVTFSEGCEARQVVISPKSSWGDETELTSPAHVFTCAVFAQSES